jgi:hypothetical protein
MRIWLIGADQRGIEVLRQLQKNSGIEVIVSAAREHPKAVVEKVIDKVNYIDQVTPLNINTLARRIRPDLILIDSSAEGRSLGRITAGATLFDALNYEIAAASDYPCLVL